MKILTIVKPQSDAKMEWDSASKRYVLAMGYFKDEFGSNFHDDGVLLKRLKQNSRKVYNFIRYRSYSQNWEVVEFMLNHTQEGKDFLLELLSTQMEADNETGYNDLSNAPAVNVANGQVLDRNQLIANQLCVDAEQIIDSSSTYFGVPICFATCYPWNYFLWVRENK